MDQSESITSHANRVLGYLCEKAVLQFTGEETIEKYFEGSIHYYHVRQALNLLLSEKYVQYARVGGAWGITARGRKFYTDGGYNTTIRDEFMPPGGKL